MDLLSRSRPHLDVWISPLLAFVVYLNTLPAEFAYDDSRAILKNPDILPETPLVNVFYDDFWGTPLTHSGSHKSYRPLCVLSFRLNYLIAGFSPLSYHLVNAILHAVVTALFVVVLKMLFVRKEEPVKRGTGMPSLTAGLLFASHPVHTEAVAGVVGRADLMSCIFFLLALMSYVRYCVLRRSYAEDIESSSVVNHQNGIQNNNHNHSNENNHKITKNTASFSLSRWLPMAGCVTFTAAAMLSKEQGITVVAICVAYDVFINERLCARELLILYKKKYRWLHEGLFLLLSITVAFISFRVYFMGSKAPEFSPSDNPASDSDSLLTRTLTFFFLPLLNFWLLVFPRNLNFDWSMGAVSLVESPFDLRNVFSLAFYAALTFAICRAVLFINQTPSVIKFKKQGSCNGEFADYLTMLSGSQTRGKAIPTAICDSSETPNFTKPANLQNGLKPNLQNGSKPNLQNGSKPNLQNGSNPNLQNGLKPNIQNGLKPNLQNGLSCSLKNLCEKRRTFHSNGSVQTGTHQAEPLFRRRQNQHLDVTLIGLCLIVFPFIPATNAFFYVGFVIAERILYIPSMGYCILVANGVDVILSACSDRKRRWKRRLVQLAVVWLILAFSVRTVMRNFDWTTEESLYRSGISTNPAKAWGNLANVLYSKGKLKEAEDAYKSALGQRSNMADVHYNLGILYQEQGQYNEAVQSYKMAIQCRPRLTMAHLNLGIVYAAVGKKSEAEHIYRHCAEIDTDGLKDPRLHDQTKVSALYNLGRLLADQDRHQEAVDVYLKAIERRPNHYQPQSLYNMLGESYSKLDRLDKAEFYYREALKSKPDHIPAHLTMAKLYQKQGLFEVAEEWYKKAENLNRNDPTVYQHYGQFLGEVGRQLESSEVFLAAARLSPNDFEIIFSAGNSLRQSGMNTEAENYYRQAVRLRPNMAVAHMNLGAMLHYNGKLMEAESSYRTALQLKPNDQMTLTNLQRLRSLVDKQTSTNDQNYADHEDVTS